MSTDPDTHAAILADAARLADGGNLQAAADALRTALEMDFQQEVAEALSMVDTALAGGLEPEIALAAIEELTESEVPIEVDDSQLGLDANAADTMPGDAIAGAEAGPGPSSSAFQTAPRRPASGMSLGELKQMLAQASATKSGPLSPVKSGRGGEASTHPREAETKPASLAPSTADTPFEPQPSDAAGARFRGSAPPPPAYRRRAAPPVPSEPAPTPTASFEDPDDDFDFFGSVAPSGSHLDIEPEVVTEGSLADAINAPDGGVADEREPTPAVRSPSSAQTQPVPQASLKPRTRRPREPFPAQHDIELDSGAMAPTEGSPVAAPDPFQTDRLRPVGAGERRQGISDLLDRVRVLLGRGDLASSKQLVDEVLATDPGHGEAQALARDITGRLAMLRIFSLEPMDRVPRQNLAAAAEVGLSPRSMFVLSMADGSSTLEDLVDLSGMPRSDATEILSELIQKGALEF